MFLLRVVLVVVLVVVVLVVEVLLLDKMLVLAISVVVALGGRIFSRRGESLVLLLLLWL